jgi:hypothetical protein
MAGLTAREMEYEAKIVYEGIASADAPGYTSRQWSVLLTKAQEKIIEAVIEEGWDKNETNRRIISKLLVNWEAETNTIDVYNRWNNAFKVILPVNYMHIAEDYANDKVRVRPVTYDYVHSNIYNPFENPFKDEFWRLTDATGVIVLTDGSELSKYSLSYIKRPEPIITNTLTEPIEGNTSYADCKLDPIVHRRIVDRAARLADAYTNNQLGYQLNALESQKI